MAKRATITDLARASGVSVATVDRVLNARAKVRKETAQRVYEAASAIGFHATPLIGQRLDEELPLLRIGVVLQKEKQYFYQAFKAEMEEAARNAHGVRCEVNFVFSPSQAPNDFVRLMDQLAETSEVITGTVVNNVETADAVQRIQARVL